MMHMQDFSPSLPDIIGVGCVWTIRERQRRSGILVSERRVKNIWTNYGLGALAGCALSPTNLYLAVESPGTTVQYTVSSGASSIVTSAQVHQTGDTQIVASVGLSNQETLSFSSAVVNSDSTCTYTLSVNTTQPHSAGDPASRQVNSTDTVSNLVSEQQYDSVNFPNQRIPVASGYSGGTGNYIFQFYYPGPTAQFLFLTVGMCDTPTIGQGNLLNHFVLGYLHNSTTNDLEIDGSLTLSNI
jgi:hypothetical protein